MRPCGNLQLITGGHGYDLAELATLTEQSTDIPVEPKDVGPQEYCQRLLRDGVSPWWAYAFTSMFQSVSEHRFETVSGDVAKLTGRPPTPFPVVIGSHG